MGNSLFGIGVSALNAAQIGLATTGHNIANAATPGYNRQEAVQASRVPQFSGVGYLGQGVNVETVRRAYDDFIESQLRYTQTQSSTYDSQYGLIKQVDDLLADPKAGLAPAMSEFFKGVQDVAAHPADAAARQSMLSASQTLAGRFQQLDSRLADLRQGVNANIEHTVGLVNGYASQVAALNQQIALATSQGAVSQAPNDLLDKRDALIRDLSKEVAVTVVKQGDGTVNVSIGGGQLLVARDRTYQLAASQDPLDPHQINVGIQTGQTTVKLRQDDVGGGNLAGYMGFRDENLSETQNALGRIATALASNFNAQHKLGQDRNGAAGGDYFSLQGASVLAASGNASTLSATISDAAQLTTSDYKVGFDGTNYNVTELPSQNTTSYSSLPQTIGGVTIALASGTPAAGDLFLVQPTRGAPATFGVAVTDTNKIAAAAPGGNIGDNRNAQLLADLQLKPLLPGGANLQGSFAQLVSQVGAKTRELQVGSEAQANLLELTQQTQQSVSGVNLDEEAAKLLRYQQAYQAASKIISAAQTMFESILSIGR